MKKSLLLLFVAVLTLVSFLSAQDKNPSVRGWIGYTTVAMSDFNFDMTNAAGATIKDVTSGMILGADIDFECTPNVTEGLRIGYLTTNQGSLKLNNIYNKFNFSLVPIMVGRKYTSKLSDTISLKTAAYAGIGLGSYKATWTNTPFYADEIVKAAGSCAMLDFSLGGDYTINEQFSVGASVGYRLAKISVMRCTKDNSKVGAVKNIKITDSFNKDMEIDFSGMSVTAGVNYNF